MTKQQGLKLSVIALAASMVIGCNSTNPTMHLKYRQKAWS